MLKWVDAPRLRPERLIAGGRVVLAVFSLFAVWLDPTEPANYAQVAYGLLVAYVVYSAAVVGLLWRAEAVAPWWPLVTHISDVIFFSLFIFFTAGPASPFTVYFVFALVAATLRWQLRGTVWTAVVALGAFFSVGFYFGVVQDSPDFDLRAFIIRGVYMMVLAVLLGYVGAHDHRVVRELRLLASWPETGSRDVESLARELLEYTGTLLEVPRVLLAWTEQDAPWQRVVVWTCGGWVHKRLDANLSVADHQAFIHNASHGGRTLVRGRDVVRLVEWSGQSVDRTFAEQFDIRNAVSVPIQGETFDGRLFVLDKTDATLDDLVLAEITASVIAARFDAFYMTEQLRQAAATEERIRLARDLHDGVLQSFTGIALKMAAIRRVMAADPAAAAATLEDVQQVLSSAQRDLRFFIEDLKPSLVSLDKSTGLSARLTELTQRMEREWDLRVQLRLDIDYDHLPATLRRDLYHLVREALINAARHGEASTAHVDLVMSDARTIAVSITDNGHGFPFTGRYTAEELARLELGPKTLRERVTAMRGSLTLDSGPSGAELRITLPAAA